MLTNNHSECIVVAQLDNADVIIEYQLKMAYETEQLQLDPKRVQEAVHYLLRSNTNKYGFYLIKIANQQPVGVCLLTYQSVAYWWMQSVYVDKEHRHQGHFTSLFQHTIKLAKQKGVKRIKLYAENNNEVAKGIYFKLGMRISLIKLYSFDFVIGGCKINDIVDKRFVFEEKYVGMNIYFGKYGNAAINILDETIASVNNNSNWIIVKYVTKEYHIVAQIYYFNEFSDWRFGVMKYISLVIIYSYTINLQILFAELISYLNSTSELPVAALRILHIPSIKLYKLLPGGTLEHYDVLYIDI